MAWDPSYKSKIILSLDNRRATKSGSAFWSFVRSDIAATIPRYAEVVATNSGSSPYDIVGLADASVTVDSIMGVPATTWGYYQQTGEAYSGNTLTAYGAPWTTGDVIGIAYDPVAGKVWFAKNDTWQNSGNPVTGANPAFSGLPSGLYLAISLYTSPHAYTGNFVTRDLIYAAPAGFARWEAGQSLSGNATKVGGGAVDQVVIRNWADRALVEIVTPASNGDWVVDVLPGDYDISYFADGCQPVCHGPYTVAP